MSQGSIKCSGAPFPTGTPTHFLDIVVTSLCPPLTEPLGQALWPAEGSSPHAISAEYLSLLSLRSSGHKLMAFFYKYPRRKECDKLTQSIDKPACSHTETKWLTPTKETLSKSVVVQKSPEKPQHSLQGFTKTSAVQKCTFATKSSSASVFLSLAVCPLII